MANLRQILEAQVEIGQSNLGGFVTDEYGDSARIDSSLQYLAGRLVQFAHNNYTQSATFFGVGTAKIFRDVFSEEEEKGDS
ncbi:MAG: hypothetical protein GTO45_12740 [Candidatus Aminicenantes bacterium]|nr:hypothetical protein [Candidatus Aminicenantes bacterium]NIM79652.1 hypothetical protein [Candidatus Aminicenantes bacterium]NIN18978.1 hypothetical protein [Candidatus Aminicenantes bacterium]NIN42880.1 hypothetical protein [Candidatus Aminicenantes bacterium]NIN85617.1 hypothetical protein [Candidatus Aminicenantes bacterium]